ncbi:MAG: response regulator [Candidatus Taylorbacteria bacterium]|nr:response regulator [Candidatus Taylorbacteria bacterium]
MKENNLNGAKIVWVEDDKFLVSLIEKRMSETGAKLVQVTDGAKAVDAVKAEKPDIVILDLLMPNLDGLEILKRLKENAETRHIPVLVLSNLGQEKEIQRAKELGAAKFIVKAAVGLDEIVPEIEKIAAK